MVDSMSQTDPLVLINVIEQEWLSLTKHQEILKTLYRENDRDYGVALTINDYNYLLGRLRELLCSSLLQEDDEMGIYGTSPLRILGHYSDFISALQERDRKRIGSHEKLSFCFYLLLCKSDIPCFGVGETRSHSKGGVC